MEKIAAFIIWFIIWGGITIAILYLIEFGFTNPLYIDWKSHLSFFIFPTILGLIGAKYNPQIEMFARFKMKSSFHKTKRII